MELVIKLSSRTPFIGVCFDKEGEGERLNQVWVNSYRDEKYKLILQQKDNGIMNVVLVKENYKWSQIYPDLKYDYPDFYNLVRSLRHRQIVNFAHITKTETSYRILRTTVNETQYVLKIEEVLLAVNTATWLASFKTALDK